MTKVYVVTIEDTDVWMQIPKVLSARHAVVVIVVVVVVVFCLPRKLFMSYFMIFKCVFVICLCSLIVDISVMCPGQVKL